MAVVTLTMDGQPLSAHDDQTLLDVAREHGFDIPTLCHLEGLGDVGACRLCLVEIEGSPRLAAACTTRPQEGMVVRTTSERLERYRRTIVEFLAAEGNHHCAVCVSNGHCELQDLTLRVGLEYVRVPYLYPAKALDASHADFVIDHNRCVLCTRCVRVCDEVEGAHTWDIANRGIACTIIAGLNQPWGEAESCTACGKCVAVCPTGALFPKGMAVAEATKQTEFLNYIVTARRRREWNHGFLSQE
ncbi:MAG: bidirectional hydrogenase complex protein HoxU [Gemmatimonadota bacterium]|nr:bidirectional hydrogenase complex protein HoxU [Gemmatimonadota bacterium]